MIGFSQSSIDLCDDAIDSQTGIIEVSIDNTWMRIVNTYLSRNMRFSTMWNVRPAKSQISLRIRVRIRAV